MTAGGYRPDGVQAGAVVGLLVFAVLHEVALPDVLLELRPERKSIGLFRTRLGDF